MKASALGATDRPAALAHLAGRERENLWLLDLVSSLGESPPPGEAGAEVVGAFDRHALRGLLALRPCVVAEAGLSDEVLEAFRPWLVPLQAGLMKSSLREADALWPMLAEGGCRPIVDRGETSWALDLAAAAPAPAPVGGRVRRARAADLTTFVVAARASLAEEERPDPFELDPEAFRRWVRGRLERAWLVEAGGRIVFVGYADVQRSEGWLLQGIYTWPEARRRGFARAGVAALCRAAFDAGADHVQLAVVAGNRAAEALYRGLGFRPFAALRTVLFEAPRA